MQSPQNGSLAQPPKYTELLWVTLVVLSSAHFALHYVWAGEHFFDLAAFSRGEVALPYQGRVLTAWLLHSGMAQPTVQHLLYRAMPRVPVQVRSPYLLLEMLIVFVSMLMALLAARAALRLLGCSRTYAAWAAFLLLGMSSCLLFVQSYVYFNLPYDVPSLAFFSVGVWLVVARRPALLSAVFVLGALNRETYIFMTLFLSLYTYFHLRPNGERSGFSDVQRIAPYLVFQIACWVAIRIGVLRAFGRNPHSMVYAIQLAGNFRSLFNPLQWPLLISLAGLLALPVLWSWRRVPDRSFTLSTFVVVVLWTAGMFVVGVLVEIRIFLELVAFLTPCVALAFGYRFLPEHMAKREVSVT